MFCCPPSPSSDVVPSFESSVIKLSYVCFKRLHSLQYLSHSISSQNFLDINLLVQIRNTLILSFIERRHGFMMFYTVAIALSVACLALHSLNIPPTNAFFLSVCAGHRLSYFSTQRLWGGSKKSTCSTFGCLLPKKKKKRERSHCMNCFYFVI